MNLKKSRFYLGLFFLSFSNLFCQNAMVAAGGTGVGSSGIVSFSVGQANYTSGSSTTGSVTLGIQQAYETSVVLGIENIDINLSLSVYPNPTSNYLNLEIRNYNLNNMSYVLTDISGKLIKKDANLSQKSTISLEGYPTAIYLLHVLENNKKLKTYKIVKRE